MKTNEIFTKALDDKNKNLIEEGKPKITNKHLAMKVFGSDSASNQVKIGNILNGVTERLHPDWIKSLCSELDLTPNQVFPQVGGDDDLGCY